MVETSIIATFIKTGNIRNVSGEFVPFKYEPSGGTLKEAPTGTTLNMRVTQEDLDYSTTSRVQPQEDMDMDSPLIEY